MIIRSVILPIMAGLLAGCAAQTEWPEHVDGVIVDNAGYPIQPQPHVVPTTQPAVATDAIHQLVARPSPPPPPPAQLDYEHPTVIKGISIYGWKPQANTSNGGWNSGAYPVLDLPATASTEEVVSKALQMSGGYGITSHTTLKVREVQLPSFSNADPSAETAVLVDTNVGEKIILFYFAGPAMGWWCRVYEAKSSS